MSARMAWLAVGAAVVALSVGCRNCSSCGGQVSTGGTVTTPNTLAAGPRPAADGVKQASASVPAAGNKMAYTVPDMP